MTIFEKATKQKIRFNSLVGLLTVEDLWDLPLSTNGQSKKVSLLDVAGFVQSDLDKFSKASFLETGNVSSEQETAELKMEILKHIRDIKVEERKAAEERAIKATKRQRLSEIIAEKEDAHLKDMPLEDLKKLQESL